MNTTAANKGISDNSLSGDLQSVLASLFLSIVCLRSSRHASLFNARGLLSLDQPYRVPTLILLWQMAV